MKGQKGFSLIELLIVVAILGVLSAIAIPTYKNQVIKSDIASGVATVKALLTNTDLHIQEENTFPTNDTTGFTAIGAASDMSALGTLSFTGIEGAAGTIKFVFNSKSAVSGSDVQFVKSANGWKCTFNKASGLTVDTDVLPKGCNEPAAPAAGG